MHKHALAIFSAGALAFGAHTAIHHTKLGDGLGDRSGGRPHIHRVHIERLGISGHHRK